MCNLAPGPWLYTAPRLTPSGVSWEEAGNYQVVSGWGPLPGRLSPALGLQHCCPGIGPTPPQASQGQLDHWGLELRIPPNSSPH